MGHKDNDAHTKAIVKMDKIADVHYAYEATDGRPVKQIYQCCVGPNDGLECTAIDALVGYLEWRWPFLEVLTINDKTIDVEFSPRRRNAAMLKTGHYVCGLMVWKDITPSQPVGYQAYTLVIPHDIDEYLASEMERQSPLIWK